MDLTLIYNHSLDAKVDLSDVSSTVKRFDLRVERKPSIFSDCRAIFRLIHFFFRERPDLVVSLVPKAGLVGMLAAYVVGIRKRLHIFQGEVWINKTAVWRCVLRFMDKVIAWSSTDCLCVSASERQFLIANQVVSSDKIKVLGRGSICGIVVSKVATLRKDALGGANILFVGRICRDKGIFDLLDVVRQIDRKKTAITLTIVGPKELDFEENLEFEARCEELTGIVSVFSLQSDLEEFYRKCDILCLPSHREGFGMVAIEASSYGRPVVGYDIVGLRDAVLNGETGLLVEPTNLTELRLAIEKLVHEPQLRESLGRAGRSYVEVNFRRDQVVARYADYMSSLVDCRP